MVGETYRLAREQDSGIDHSTLNRTLDTFAKLDLVIDAENLEGARLFEIVQEELHHHLVYRRCGGEIEIESAIVNGFYRDLQIAHNYEVKMDPLIILWYLRRLFRRK